MRCRKICSLLLLFIFPISIQVYGRPITLDLEPIRGQETFRNNPPLHHSNIQGGDSVEPIQIAARGDGNGKQLTKAGNILDKVGTGLTAASAAANAIPGVGQIESAALTIIKTAVDIFSKALSAIGKAQQKDALKRGAFTQDVVDQTLKKHPGWNCIVVHPKHKKSFKGSEGKDWAHSQEVKVKFPVGSTIGFEIYTFREGNFELQGNGGSQNWGYGGNVIKGDAKSKKLTFGASANAKGSASNAVKGTGQKAAKDGGKKTGKTGKQSGNKSTTSPKKKGKREPEVVLV